jgi:hypothetical protein
MLLDTVKFKIEDLHTNDLHTNDTSYKEKDDNAKRLITSHDPRFKKH